MFQASLVHQQVLVRMFRLVQFAVKQIHGLLDLSHFLHDPVVGRIATQFHIRTMSTGLQTRLGHLQRRLLVSYSLLQMLDMFLLLNRKLNFS